MPMLNTLLLKLLKLCCLMVEELLLMMSWRKMKRSLLLVKNQKVLQIIVLTSLKYNDYERVHRNHTEHKYEEPRKRSSK